jgi:hypothetical protein
VGKPDRKKPLGRSMDVRGIELGGMGWIHLTQDRASGGLLLT